MKKIFLVVGLTCLVLTVISSYAFATEEVIYGCVGNGRIGNLRVVSDPSQCKRFETPVMWNVVGPQGPAGAEGPEGPIGPTGPQGPVGPEGPQGPQGVQGATGPDGAQGEQGSQGEPGEPGQAGTDGLNCWDLNGNRTCDLSIEDKNNDSICDSSDCQGPPGAGGIQVYDAEGQYVGALVEIGSLSNAGFNDIGTIGVFMPGLNKFALIGGMVNPKSSTFPLYFEGHDCTGEAYWPQNSYYVARLRNDFIYYTGGDLLVPEGADWSEWSTLTADGTCTNYGCCLNIPLYEPVAVPVTDLPYVPPLTGPLSFR